MHRGSPAGRDVSQARSAARGRAASLRSPSSAEAAVPSRSTASRTGRKSARARHRSRPVVQPAQFHVARLPGEAPAGEPGGENMLGPAPTPLTARVWTCASATRPPAGIASEVLTPRRRVPAHTEHKRARPNINQPGWVPFRCRPARGVDREKLAPTPPDREITTPPGRTIIQPPRPARSIPTPRPSATPAPGSRGQRPARSAASPSLPALP